MTETPCFIWGAFSLEVGPKAHKLHFQGTAIIRWPTKKDMISILAKYIKELFPNKGKGYRVAVKSFSRGQSKLGMLGYIIKDEGTN